MVETRPNQKTNIKVGLDPSQKSVLANVGKIAQGDLPSTSEIESGLERTKNILDEQKDKPGISEHGEKLLDKTKDVVDSTEALIVEKDMGDRVQRIVHNIAETGKDVASKEQSRLDGKDVAPREELMDLVNNTRDVASFVISYSNFRALLMDIADLFLSILGKIQERHGEDLKQSVNIDLEKKKGEESASLRAAQDVAQDLREGRLVDEKFKREIDDRFGRLLMDLGENAQYRDAVNGLFTIVDRLHLRAQQAQEAAQDALDEEQNRLREIQEDSIALIRDFAGETAFFDDFQNLYKQIQHDTELRQLLDDLRQFITKSLDHPEILNSERAKQELSNLSNRVIVTVDQTTDNLRNDVNNLFNSGREMLSNIREDKELKDLREKISSLLQEATTDERGLPDLFVMQQSLQEMRKIIVPAVVEQLHNVPLPMIEGRTNTYKYRLENMSLDAAEFMPEEFDLRLLSDMSIHQGHDVSENLMTTVLRFSVQGMKPKLRNFNFYFKRFAFPYIEDEGVASVDIHGDGMWILIDWAFVKEPESPARVKLRRIICKIHRLDITIHKGKHKVLDNIVLTIFHGLIKHLVEVEVQKQIGTRIQDINMALNNLLDKNYNKYKSRGGFGGLMEAANVGLKRSAESVMEHSSSSSSGGGGGGGGGDSQVDESSIIAEKIKEPIKTTESVECHPEPPLVAPGIGDSEYSMFG